MPQSGTLHQYLSNMSQISACVGRKQIVGDFVCFEQYCVIFYMYCKLRFGMSDLLTCL